MEWVLLLCLHRVLRLLQGVLPNVQSNARRGRVRSKAKLRAEAVF